MGVIVQLEINQEAIERLAAAIAAEMGGKKVEISSTEITKQNIIDFMDDEGEDISTKDMKAVLKPFGFKTIKHIDEESDDLAEILEGLKELIEESGKTELPGKEIELDSLEKGDENIVLYDEDNEILAEGEVERVLKTTIIIDGEKIKFSEITTVMQTESDDTNSNDPNEEVTVELVREVLQAYKKEFGNEEYKSVLKGYDIKKMADLEDMDEDDLVKIYSEICE